MKKYILKESQVKKILNKLVSEQEERMGGGYHDETHSDENGLNKYLPGDLKDNEEALDIMQTIIDLLDKLNNSDGDQSENGVSDQMRKMAIHMLETNF